MEGKEAYHRRPVLLEEESHTVNEPNPCKIMSDFPRCFLSIKLLKFVQIPTASDFTEV